MYHTVARAMLVSALAAVVPSTGGAQRTSNRDKALSTAILETSADFVKATLKSGAPFLLDSVALRTSRPEQEPGALVAGFGRRARLSTETQAIQCAEANRRCAVQDRGVFATVLAVKAVGDSALATVDLRWTVEPKPQDEFVAGVRVQFVYAWSGSNWVHKRTVTLREY